MSSISRPSVDIWRHDFKKSDLKNQVLTNHIEITSVSAGDDTEQRSVTGLSYERNASCNI